MFLIFCFFSSISSAITLDLNTSYDKCANTWYLTADSVHGQLWEVQGLSVRDIVVKLNSSKVWTEEKKADDKKAGHLFISSF